MLLIYKKVCRIYSFYMDFIDIRCDLKEDISIKEFLKSHHIGRGMIESIRVSKSSYINGIKSPIESIIHFNDVLRIEFNETVNYVPEFQPLEIIYEDDYLLAVNKPVGLIIHPDSDKGIGTLCNIVAGYYIKNNIYRKVRYLHRLDKDTTGVVLFAKDFYTEALMLSLIENNKINRKYVGLVEGHLANRFGTIDFPLLEDNSRTKRMKVNVKGKKSITKYNVLSRFQDYDEVEFELVTGRTHQIRVHSSYINHPIIGDCMYGRPSRLINRQALHCLEISFIHPIFNNEISITAELPIDIKALIDINY